MFNGKKWLSLLLCVLMLAGLSAGALAEGEPSALKSALQAGQEVEYAMDFTWHANPLVTDEQNEMLASLFASLALQGRYAGVSASDNYGEFTAQISGSDALSMAWATTEQGQYMQSSMLSQPTAILNDQIDGFMNNLNAYYAAQTGTEVTPVPPVDFSAAAAVPAPQADLTEEEIMEQMVDAFDVYGLGDMLEMASQWVDAKASEPIAYEGRIETVFDVETSNANVYQLTREELRAYFTACRPYFENNEVFWGKVLEQLQMSESLTLPNDVDEEITLEDLMNAVPEAFAAIDTMITSLSEDSIMRYNECFDANGEYVLSQIEVALTQEESDGVLVFYMEWLPQGVPMYMEFTVDGDGFSMAAAKKDDNSGFIVMFNLVSMDEVSAQFQLDVSCTKENTENAVIASTTVLLGLMDPSTSQMVLGMQIDVRSSEATVEDQVAYDNTVSIGMLMEGQAVPMFSVHYQAETVEPKGLPFAIVADAFAYPGAMTETDFTAYMDETVGVMMQNVFAILGMMPQDVFTYFMSTTMEATPTMEAVEMP